MTKALFLFLPVLLFCCKTSSSYKEPRKDNYDLGVSEIEGSHYVLDINGESFYYFSKGFLIKIALASNKRDSLAFITEKAYCINLLSSATGISILLFDKKNQYSLKDEKQVYLLNYDFNLNFIDSTIFTTYKETHLLSEDFQFVSLFANKSIDKYFFNDVFGNMKTVTEGKWPFITQERTSVDIINGIVYKVIKDNSKDNEFILSSSDSTGVHLKGLLSPPSQFSVINRKAAFYFDKILYYKTNSSTGWNSFINDIFNPCRRYKDGVYQLHNNGVLFLAPLFDDN